MELASTQSQHEFNLARWDEVVADPRFGDLHPACVETDRYGHLLLMAPPTIDHDEASAEISQILRAQLGPKAFATIPISTSDGAKVADAAWMSPARRAIVKSRRHKLAAVAPEIVVEVMSPGNTWGELRFKGNLYFEACAEEFWSCDTSGKLHFFANGGTENETGRSARCPGFPGRIDV